MSVASEPDLFDLNQHQLDREWLEQPCLYHRVALKVADLRVSHERAKAERDLTAAEADADIRLHPGKFGLEKLTEAVVANAVLREPAYKRALTAVIDAKHALDVAEAALRALEHRKAALENLVVLQGRDYFAAPHAPREVQEQRAAAVFGQKRRGG